MSVSFFNSVAKLYVQKLVLESIIHGCLPILAKVHLDVDTGCS